MLFMQAGERALSPSSLLFRKVSHLAKSELGPQSERVLPWGNSCIFARTCDWAQQAQHQDQPFQPYHPTCSWSLSRMAPTDTSQ